MHGLINKAVEVFVTESYGAEVWGQIAKSAQLADGGFEPMLSYPDDITDRTLEACLEALEKERDGFLEDLGTFLVSNPALEGVRRLLRFNGNTFPEFIDALEDLQDRARLAVADLDLPDLEVENDGRNCYRVRCVWHRDYALPVVLGVLRAMADDYGVLAFIDAEGDGEAAALTIQLLDKQFSEGRAFSLGASLP